MFGVSSILGSMSATENRRAVMNKGQMKIYYQEITDSL